MRAGGMAGIGGEQRIRKVVSPTRRRMDHRFYTVMAFAIAAGVFAGFTRTYYARSYFHSPAIPFWVHVHGAVFTGWILFYLLQNLLAMYGRMKLHRSLGIVGGILASGVVVLGSAVALRQARQGRFFPFPDRYSLLAVSFGQMALFAVFIYFGLRLRRDGETHKRLILMATQLFFFPAFGRALAGINMLTLSLALCFGRRAGAGEALCTLSNGVSPRSSAMRICLLMRSVAQGRNFDQRMIKARTYPGSFMSRVEMKARRSASIRAGCSMAAKWPPAGGLLQWTTL